MKTLCIQYTPDNIYLSIAIDTITKKTESFSSKELKTTINHVQKLLAATESNIETMHNICVNTGPAPAFTQRSLFALWNGVIMTLRLQNIHINLFAIDDFKLLYTIQQQKNPNDFVITLTNAYANDLFFLYYEGHMLKSGVTSLDAFVQYLNQLKKVNTVRIAGNITKEQEEIFIANSFMVTNNISIAHADYCRAALASTQTQKPIDYLLPHYTKLHTAELKKQ